MPKDTFLEKLEKLEIPTFEMKEHKESLEKNLIKSLLKRDHHAFFSFLSGKKFLSVGGAAFLIFLVWLFSGDNFLSPKTGAQEILSQTIEEIETKVTTKGRMTEELKATLDLLNTALQTKDLRYMGEEKLNDDIIKKFTFTDESIGEEIFITINPDLDLYYLDQWGNLQPENEKYYPYHIVNFDFVSSYNRISASKTIEGNIKDKKIVNLKEIQEIFKDPKQHNQLALELIQRENMSIILEIERNLKQNGSWCEEPFGGSSNSSLAKDPEQDITEEDLAKNLIPLLRNADALVQYILCEKDKKGHIASFSIGITPASDLKNKREMAREKIKKLIEKLKIFTSDLAEAKTKILEKALKSNDLVDLGKTKIEDFEYLHKLVDINEEEKTPESVERTSEYIEKSYKEVEHLSFSFEDLRISIYHDQKQKSEESIIFEFFMGEHFVQQQNKIEEKTIPFKGKIENGKIIDAQKVFEKLRDNNPNNNYLAEILWHQNQRQLYRLYSWENQLNPALKSVKKLAELLKPYIENAEISVESISWEERKIHTTIPDNIKSFSFEGYRLPESLFE